MFTQDINMKKKQLKTNASDVLKIPNAMAHQNKVMDNDENEAKAPLSKVSNMPKKAGLYSAAEKMTMGGGKMLYKMNNKNKAAPLLMGAMGAMGAKADGGSALEGGLRGAASQINVLPGVSYQNLSGNIKAKTQSGETEDQKRRGLIYNKLQNNGSNTNNIPSIGR